MKRRVMAVILLAVMCASLAVTAGADPSFIDSVGVDPYYVAFQNDGGTMSLLSDDSGATCWSVFSSQGIYNDANADAIFYFAGETVDGMWIRAGHYANESSYYDDGFPTAIRLTVIVSGGQRYQVNLNPVDLYNPFSSATNWRSGYQYLSFGQRFTDVDMIEMSVTAVRPGTYGHCFCISDLVFVRRLSQDGKSGGSGSWSATPRTSIDTTLIMRLSTRTGPSTNYTELGSYFSPGHEIRVITAAWDRRNNIYWLQVEFTYHGELRRAYTGLKRVNVEISQVPLEQLYCSDAWTTQNVQAFYGPGTNYTMYPEPVPAGTHGTVYNVENGFVQLEYTPAGSNRIRRVWINSTYVSR